MSEEEEKKPVSESKAVVATDYGTRYRALRSGMGRKRTADRD